jgi:hypothetical protein
VDRARTEIPTTVCAVTAEEKMAAMPRNHAFIHNAIVNENKRKMLYEVSIIPAAEPNNQRHLQKLTSAGLQADHEVKDNGGLRLKK